MTKDMQPYLSVVFPSYNESRNIKRGVLDEIWQFLKSYPQSWELILSDDGSTDGSLAILEQFAKRDARIKLLRNPHRGKGPTVTAGMLAAQGQWRLFADLDQSTPLAEVEKLLTYSKNYQVIIGSRETSGASRSKEPFYRHLMGRVFNFLVRSLTIPEIEDTQCGFKLFSAQATQTLFPRLCVYAGDKERQDAFTGAFDVELLYLAKKYHFPIREVGIKWQHYQTNRVNPIKDSLLMLIDIIKIRMADWSGRYPKHDK